MVIACRAACDGAGDGHREPVGESCGEPTTMLRRDSVRAGSLGTGEMTLYSRSKSTLDVSARLTGDRGGAAPPIGGGIGIEPTSIHELVRSGLSMPRGGDADLGSFVAAAAPADVAHTKENTYVRGRKNTDGTSEQGCQDALAPRTVASVGRSLLARAFPFPSSAKTNMTSSIQGFLG